MNPHKPGNAERFTNQYLVTDRPVEKLTSWNVRQFGPLYVYTHPSLETSCQTANESIFMCLGYIYDYRHPTKNNAEIVEALKIEGTLEEIVGQLKYLSGVYVILWIRNGQIHIFPDTSALREIYYVKNSEAATIVCSSIPLLLYAGVDIKRNESRGNVFFGDKTPYKGTYRLKPNHYLNVNEGIAKRFFPTIKLQPANIHSVVEEASHILKGLVSAILHRKEKVFFNLTAGWDSRVLLAASREHFKDITFVVDSVPESPLYDKEISFRLARKLKLTLIVLRFEPELNKLIRKLSTKYMISPQVNSRLTIGCSLAINLFQEM